MWLHLLILLALSSCWLLVVPHDLPVHTCCAVAWSVTWPDLCEGSLSWRWLVASCCQGGGLVEEQLVHQDEALLGNLAWPLISCDLVWYCTWPLTLYLTLELVSPCISPMTLCDPAFHTWPYAILDLTPDVWLCVTLCDLVFAPWPCVILYLTPDVWLWVTLCDHVFHLWPCVILYLASCGLDLWPCVTLVRDLWPCVKLSDLVFDLVWSMCLLWPRMTLATDL